MRIVCPCCSGQGEIETNEPPPVPLTPLQYKIFELVRRFDGLDQRTIANLAYADDPGGGPDSAENAIAVTIHNMNQRLKLAGLRISSDGRGGSGYRMRRLPVDKVSDTATTA